MAAGALKPGGWLLAYSGEAFLPDVIERLAVPELAYRWVVKHRCTPRTPATS